MCDQYEACDDCLRDPFCGWSFQPNRWYSYDNIYYEYIDPRQGKQLRSNNYDKTMIKLHVLKKINVFKLLVHDIRDDNQLQSCNLINRNSFRSINLSTYAIFKKLYLVITILKEIFNNKETVIKKFNWPQVDFSKQSLPSYIVIYPFEI